MTDIYYVCVHDMYACVLFIDELLYLAFVMFCFEIVGRGGRHNTEQVPQVPAGTRGSPAQSRSRREEHIGCTSHDRHVRNSRGSQVPEGVFRQPGNNQGRSGLRGGRTKMTGRANLAYMYTNKLISIIPHSQRRI